MSRKIVLDSYALLAYLENEPGAQYVRKILEEAKNKKTQLFLSYINLAEVYYWTIRDHGAQNANITLSIIKKLPINTISVNGELVIKAAEIKAFYPIALGDCFAVALAIQENAAVLTGDPEFKKVSKLVKIRWL